MASPVCLRCLARSLPHPEQLVTRTGVVRREAAAAFSTSSALSANPPKKKTGGVPPSVRIKSTLKIKKSEQPTTRSSRTPGSGERKEMRKKVTVTNNNALAVPGMEDLDIDSLALSGDGVALSEMHGRVLGLSEQTVESLKALKTFSPTQAWHLFKRPATLIRRETVQMAKQFIEAEDGRESGTVREIIFGEQGSGKSVLLLQAQAMALVKKWVVISLPDANGMTNGNSPFMPIRNAGARQYIQPKYTAELLRNIVSANRSVLDDLQLSRKHDLPIPVQSNMSLTRLAELGATDTELAWPIWTAFWKEITAKDASQPRPPILLTVDGIDHVMRETAYIDANMQTIHAFDLTLVAHVADCLSGRTSLPNGGMVLGAVSQSNRGRSPTLDFFLAHRYARGQTADGVPKRVRRVNPFEIADVRVEEVMKALTHVMKVEGLSKAEARGIMEYYAQSGILRANVTDRLVSEKWTMSGGGNVGLLERSSLAMGM